MKYYIGIDPGSHGAISLIDESSKPIESHVYNKFEVADILKRYKSDYIDKGISVMCALCQEMVLSRHLVLAKIMVRLRAHLLFAVFHFKKFRLQLGNENLV